MKDIPKFLHETKAKALRAMAPLRPASKAEVAAQPGVLYAHRIWTSASLPPYYLVYFLLAELLDYSAFGTDEKVAWTIPIALEDRLLAIQHRKGGLGIFSLAPDEDQDLAERAVYLLQKAAKEAAVYFDWKAKTAVEASQLNVVNRNKELYERFQYFLTKYRSILAEARERKGRAH